MTIDERCEFVGVIFARIRAKTETGQVQPLLREPWKRCVSAVATCGTDLSGRRGSSTRKW
jgi:hypothetical protein